MTTYTSYTTAQIAAMVEVDFTGSGFLSPADVAAFSTSQIAALTTQQINSWMTLPNWEL